MTNLTCKICNTEIKDYLGDHLLEAHNLSIEDYLVQFPGAETVSQRLLAKYNAKRIPRRALPVDPNKLTIEFAGIEFPVNTEVPEEVCLPMPSNYRIPKFGQLGMDILHAAIGLKNRRSLYIWGLPGSGKDALFHAWSAMTRTPAIIKQVKPGTDIESWFFSRSFNEAGTFWEEGEVLKALRDGYKTASGKTIPYMLLVSDFDRADKEQAEHLRLITDSIQGRVDGPAGKVYKVLPATIVAATANTAGGGDERGRMISANPLDASLLDRFDRKFQFRWMDWQDESVIVQSKFPILTQRCPDIFEKMGKVTMALREAILNDELHAEFSHRALCNILGHASDIIECNGTKKVPKDLMKKAARAWLDGLPDEENRDAARKIMDPHFGTLEEGDTSHINNTTNANPWA
jgi:MoxR-like ATPase